MFPTTLIVFILSFTSAFAMPTKKVNLDDIQCRCLTFSTSAAPTHCMYQEHLTLDWEMARSLATANDLKMQFASDKAIAKVLSVPRPLPATFLDVIHQGKTLPLDPSKEVRSENRLICGFGNDLEYVESQGAGIKPEIHYVGTVLGIFMLLFIVYLVVEYAWVRCTSRTKRIMLEGEEKALTADQVLDNETAVDDAAKSAFKHKCSMQMASPTTTTMLLSDWWPLLLSGNWGPMHLALEQHYRASALSSGKNCPV